MKKITRILQATILFACTWVALADRSTPDSTRTQIALPLRTAPTIDGTIAAGEWSLAGGAAGSFWNVTFDDKLDDKIRGGALGDGAANPPKDSADLSFTVFAGYDANNLYVAVRVKDDVLQEDSAAGDSEDGTTWMDDSVEVFIDGDNSNFPQRDTSGSNADVVGTGGQYVITVNNAYRHAEAGKPGYGPNQAWFAKTAKTADGYEAEFRISLKSIGNPKPGELIGFTVAVNDDDDGGGGERQVIWVGKPHTECSYGNLLLSGREYTAPKTAAPTVDGRILPSEYAGATPIRIDSNNAIFDIPSGDDTFSNSDLSYSAWIVHAADAIYVAVDITDDSVNTDSAEADSEDGNTWEDDSVEIFFDPNNSKDPGRGSEKFEGQYVISANGAHRDNEANNPAFGESGDWHAKTQKTFKGYQVEFKIKKNALLNPADGGKLGFHIAVNDDDGSNREAQMGWSGRAHSEFTYGVLHLGGAAQVSVDPVGRKNADPTRTQFAHFLETAPTIDGTVKPDEWRRAGGAAGDFWRVVFNDKLADKIQGGALGDGSNNPPKDSADLSYVVYAGYDAKNLYVAVKVTDDVIQDDSAAADSEDGTTWMDDSVEVFVDGDNSNFPVRDTSGSNRELVGSGGQYVITVNNAYRHAEAGKPGYGGDQVWYAKTAKTAAGYDAEFRIALSAIGNPKPGELIGFTVAVNDDDDGGGGERQVIWVGKPHIESSYGNLILGARSYDAVKSAAPTVDGIIRAAEYANAQEIRIHSENAVFDIPSGDDTFETDDLSYRAWVVHSADSVFVAVDVMDSVVTTDSAEAGSEDGNTWEDDSVEIFFDPNNSKDVGRGGEKFEGQYVISANGAWRDNEANNPTFGESGDWFASTKKTLKGYQVEFRVKKSALLNPADGSSLGFHIAVNDDDGANREAQMGWSGRAHSEFTYGKLTLVGSGSSGGGNISIRSATIAGNNLELTVATSSATGNHVIQRTPQLSPIQWTDVSGVTFRPGSGGTIIGTFPKPAAQQEFYRVLLR